MSHDRYDVAIIGAGFSGLAAAVRLAHFGRRVLVLERHSVWGGLNSFYKKGGYHFDTGLHAVTNWVRPGYKGPRLPLQRVCRQLRIGLDELALEPQTVSETSSAGVTLRFSNDFSLFEEEIRAKFPREIDGFRRLAAACVEYPELGEGRPKVSTRAVVSEHIADPILRDLVLLPTFFYGNAAEDDFDFDQFVILFNSIFREGFSRPRRGVRQFLDLLRDRLERSGGEVRRSAGVQRIVVEDGRVKRLELDGGDTIEADVVLSSAGFVETMRLRSDLPDTTHADDIGRLGFVETIWVIDEAPAKLGYAPCVGFFNLRERLEWRQPKEPVDFATGVTCCPSSYQHAEPLETHLVRTTHLAQPEPWLTWDDERYEAEKSRFVARSLEVVSAHTKVALAPRVKFTDAFTPRTVKRYTGHENGAIYGSPNKQTSGRTDVANLFLCGTDQGFVGIVGSMLSGINVANAHGMGANMAGGDA